MAKVVPITPSPGAVNAAWRQYQALAAPVIESPKLLLERQHMAALAIAEAKWKRTFLASVNGEKRS